MKYVVVLAALALGCASTAATSRTRSWSREEVAQRVTTSSAPDLAKLLRAPLGYGGLWFDDPACQQQFIAPGVIEADRIDAFARCLSTLQLRVSERKNPFPDVMVLNYPPGFEVEAQFQNDNGPTIRWIGYAGRHDTKDALPAVTPSALEELRVAGDRIPKLDEPTRARLARERDQSTMPASAAWLKVCVDADGNVTGAHPREESSPIAGDVFSSAVMQWKFRPFIVGGRAIPVCSMIRLADPPGENGDEASRMLPHPIPAELGSVMVSTRALHRISGSPFIQPDDSEKFEIMQSDLSPLFASFAYCIDEHGDVTAVQRLRSSSLVRYDDRIQRAMEDWKYKPYVIEGKAMAACAAITYIYSQGK